MHDFYVQWVFLNRSMSAVTKAPECLLHPCTWVMEVASYRKSRSVATWCVIGRFTQTVSRSVSKWVSQDLVDSVIHAFIQPVWKPLSGFMSESVRQCVITQSVIDWSGQSVSWATFTLTLALFEKNAFIWMKQRAQRKTAGSSVKHMQPCIPGAFLLLTAQLIIVAVTFRSCTLHGRSIISAAVRSFGVCWAFCSNSWLLTQGWFGSERPLGAELVSQWALNSEFWTLLRCVYV